MFFTMLLAGFALFDTAIGPCGVVWGPHGIRAVHLPEETEAQTRLRVLQRFPEAHETLPVLAAQQAIDQIAALLRGEPRDLRTLQLDYTGLSAFYRQVYTAARAIPVGQTSTYGALAAELGDKGAARAVGQALGRNPFAIVVPCHRVLAAGGKIGGFSANGGTITKRLLLQIERVQPAPALMQPATQLQLF